MADIYKNDYYSTDLQKININPLKHFSTNESLDQILDNKISDSIEIFLENAGFDNLVLLKRKNHRYLKNEHCNIIFNVVHSKYKNRINSVVMFDLITTYYNIVPSDFWKSLTLKHKSILNTDLKELTGIQAPLGGHEVRLNKKGLLTPELF